ncbi:hypothetical protein Y880_0900001 [Pseudomonas aeruginosa PAK]|nr:hypothetical protein Y880_0900001 [Pseudomonas aeruginosa PAK]
MSTGAAGWLGRMRLRFHDAGWPFERADPAWGRLGGRYPRRRRKRFEPAACADRATRTSRRATAPAGNCGTGRRTARRGTGPSARRSSAMAWRRSCGCGSRPSPRGSSGTGRRRPTWRRR